MTAPNSENIQSESEIADVADYAFAETHQPPVEKSPEPETSDPEVIVVNKCDPITRRFKRVTTRRIRKHDFYSDKGKLIDDESEE